MNVSTDRHLRAPDRTRPSGRPRSAFTLIELVVAMLMVAVLAVSLYSSMKIAFTAQNSAEAAIEPPRTAELAMDLIRTDILNAVTPNPNATNLRVLALAFTGVQGSDDRGHPNDDLIFCTTSDGPQPAPPQQASAMTTSVLTGYGDIRQVELTIITSPNGTDHLLVRRVTSNLLTQDQIDPDDEVICRNVSSFQLEYFDGSSWNSTWDSTQDDNMLPSAVRVTIELERPAGPVQNSQGVPVFRFSRVFPLPCSTSNQTGNQLNLGGL